MKIRKGRRRRRGLTFPDGEGGGPKEEGTLKKTICFIPTHCLLIELEPGLLQDRGIVT